MARSHAIATRTSLSRAIGDLLRRRQMPAAGPSDAVGSEADSYFDPELGIRVSRSSRPIAEGEIQRSLNDEDARQLERMGLAAEEIEHRLEP